MTGDIILCDDEIHILRAAQFKLQRAGYEIRAATDGEEAWNLIAERPPDLVITDCQMPRLDGLGLIVRARQYDETRDLPFFMLTAKGFELDHTELTEKWNVLRIIAKPFSPRELLEDVKGVLQPITA